MTCLYASAVAAILVIVPQPRTPRPEQLPITDPAAYKVYAAVVPPAWANVRPKGTMLLLQQETDIPRPCAAPASPQGDEWDAVERNYRENNTRVHRLLQSMLLLDVPYRLISQAEIEADDARLALKYPGIWQRRPESMDFVAVSAVGFNVEGTKALVYVRARDSGTVRPMELLDGQWVHAKGRGCGWIA
ncbi:MAG: hypothetical protein H0U94_14165 [Acidobacteria bacterium]|nr:hypothetical protein [Acidobacteriota bacterium]